jgi:hypothetical protein
MWILMWSLPKLLQATIEGLPWLKPRLPWLLLSPAIEGSARRVSAIVVRRVAQEHTKARQ